MNSYTIAGINRLSNEEKRAIFLPLIPSGLLKRFSLPEDLIDPNGNSLISFEGGAEGARIRIKNLPPIWFSRPDSLQPLNRHIAQPGACFAIYHE